MVFAFQAGDNRDARCIPGWFLRRARHWTGVRNLRSARWYKATSWPQARSASGSFSAALPSGKHQPCTAWGETSTSARIFAAANASRSVKRNALGYPRIVEPMGLAISPS